MRRRLLSGCQPRDLEHKAAAQDKTRRESRDETSGNRRLRRGRKCACRDGPCAGRISTSRDVRTLKFGDDTQSYSYLRILVFSLLLRPMLSHGEALQQRDWPLILRESPCYFSKALRTHQAPCPVANRCFSKLVGTGHSRFSWAVGPRGASEDRLQTHPCRLRSGPLLYMDDGEANLC